MKVAVVGPQGLEELERLVREKFAGVANTGAEAPEFSVSFTEGAGCGGWPPGHWGSCALPESNRRASQI